MPTDTVTDLRWTLPLRADEYGSYVFDANGHMIVQIRGWGHLTGQGGLRLPEDEAIAVQVARGKAIAAAVNAAHAQPEAAPTVENEADGWRWVRVSHEMVEYLKGNTVPVIVQIVERDHREVEIVCTRVEAAPTPEPDSAEWWRQVAQGLGVEVARMKRLAKEATNGWACHATRKREHDEIARLHREIDAHVAEFGEGDDIRARAAQREVLEEVRKVCHGEEWFTIGMDDWLKRRIVQLGESQP